MRTITLEEHFATPGFLEGPGRSITGRAGRMAERMVKIVEQLRDLGEKRIGGNGRGPH